MHSSLKLPHTDNGETKRNFRQIETREILSPRKNKSRGNRTAVAMVMKRMINRRRNGRASHDWEVGFGKLSCIWLGIQHLGKDSQLWKWSGAVAPSGNHNPSLKSDERETYQITRMHDVLIWSMPLQPKLQSPLVATWITLTKKTLTSHIAMWWWESPCSNNFPKEDSNLPLLVKKCFNIKVSFFQYFFKKPLQISSAWTTGFD